MRIPSRQPLWGSQRPHGRRFWVAASTHVTLFATCPPPLDKSPTLHYSSVLTTTSLPNPPTPHPHALHTPPPLLPGIVGYAARAATESGGRKERGSKWARKTTTAGDGDRSLEQKPFSWGPALSYFFQFWPFTFFGKKNIKKMWKFFNRWIWQTYDFLEFVFRLQLPMKVLNLIHILFSFLNNHLNWLFFWKK